MDSEPSTAVDLRSLEIVSDYSGHLMCAVCHCPFIRPLRLRCDHIFCQSCLSSCMTLSPPPDSFHCPTCRTPTNASFQSVPRLVSAMCDEILVKCPFAREGCEETVQRGHVQAHVDKYCDYRLLPCPDEGCEKKIRKKDMDVDGRCLHGMRECEECHDEVMELEYQSHTTALCPKLSVSCPDCEVSLTQDELDAHREICVNATRTCKAAPYGCKARLGISEVEEHEKSCTLAMLGPYLEGQSSRMASMDSTIRQLQQRNEVLEEGIASIRSTLTRHTPRTLSELTHDTQQTPTRTDTPDEATRSQQEIPTTTPSPSSSSTTTTYLLAIHESLREEVSRLSSALNDVDARANMSIVNENLRLREDMAHINAAINTVRMQVHMLMNLRFHHQGQGQGQGQRAEHANARAAPHHGAGGGAGGGAGDANVMGAAAAAGPSRFGGAVSEVLRGRRLSDSSREGTKL